MVEVMDFLREAGNSSLSALWFPVVLWTLMAILTILILKFVNRLYVAYHYHGRAALLLALPVGLAASYLTGSITSLSTGGAYSTKFLVVEYSLSTVPAGIPESAMSTINWADPILWIGILLALTTFFALLRIVKIGYNYAQLYKFSTSLRFKSILSLSDLSPQNHRLASEKNPGTQVAFSERVRVPFTFGWWRSKIVLPANFSNHPGRMNMAVRHELMHIRHYDFLLNNLLMTIKSLFWFHPLVHLLYGEFKAWREISCDAHVLSDPAISKKSYAQLLFDLSSHQECYGRASVSMAVDPSTLKKRIRVIKSGTVSPDKIRHSFFLMCTAALVITGIMACSDLQNPGLDNHDQATAQGPPAPVPLEGGLQTLPDWENPPLYVINGQEMETPGDSDSNPLSKIDPASIQSIEVLKEEAGRSQYGEKAEHGVVIITLKNKEADLSTVLNEKKLKPPPPPPEPNSESTGDFFVAVEEMPELKGTLGELQSQARYPRTARRAGIEGTVIVQFIVNEEGTVENPQVIRGIGGGLNEEALRIVKMAEFEPGKQRGNPVSVQYSLPIVFQLKKDNTTEDSRQQ